LWRPRLFELINPAWYPKTVSGGLGFAVAFAIAALGPIGGVVFGISGVVQSVRNPSDLGGAISVGCFLVSLVAALASFVP
jgi:hypothetical protein